MDDRVVLWALDSYRLNLVSNGSPRFSRDLTIGASECDVRDIVVTGVFTSFARIRQRDVALVRNWNPAYSVEWTRRNV